MSIAPALWLSRVRPALPVARWIPRQLLASMLLPLLLLFAGPLAAQVELAPDAPQSYVVQPGDTLWSIAGRFLRDPWRWPDVWQANPSVANPNKIFPGDVLELVYQGGSPRIRSSRGGGGMRTVKLSPRVRVTELDREIPTIPVNAVAPFLSRPVVTESREIDDAPYVVGFPDGRLLAGTGGTIFVRSILNAESDRYEVLRPGKEYRDPETNRVLGFEAAYVGTARIERLGDPATLTVTRSQRQVAIGDRVRPARDDEPIRSFFPRPAPAGLRGNIISVLNGVSQIGQYDVVVLSRGARKGVEVGHVFEVYRGGELRRDPVRNKRTAWNWRNETPLDTSFWYGDWELDGWNRDKPDPDAPLPLHRRAVRMDDTYIVPDSRSGVVMVFRVFPEVSFALVMSATQAMHVGEIVAPPRDL
ncbi:MAG: LysM peptidoglycan-binding domain-containing protein [Thiohalocapsa sp.]